MKNDRATGACRRTTGCFALLFLLLKQFAYISFMKPLNYLLGNLYCRWLKSQSFGAQIFNEFFYSQDLFAGLLIKHYGIIQFFSTDTVKKSLSILKDLNRHDHSNVTHKYAKNLINISPRQPTLYIISFPKMKV